jgi:uncharacterized membrane protein
MPEVSAFCPGCGRTVEPEADAYSVAFIPALSRYALLAVIAYFTAIPAAILLAIPSLRSSRFVRFHAWQSVLFSVAAVVIAAVTWLVFSLLSHFFVGFLLASLTAGLVALALVFLWMAIVVKAALGDTYELPFIGRWAGELANLEGSVHK